MTRKLESHHHCKHIMIFHYIFVCKYHRTVFANQRVANWLIQEIQNISQKYDFEIEAVNIDGKKPHHIHIMVRLSNPDISVSQVCRVLKQHTTYDIWQKFPQYMKKFYWKEHHLWTRGYFVSTIGNVSADAIQKYIEEQGSDDC